MTREQIDAIERLYTERSDSLIASGYSIPELLAAARRALELEKALEYAAGDAVSLYKAGDGRFCCVMFDGSADLEKCFYGATPLEAINNARGNHGG